MARVIVGRNSSRCSECSKGADPNETYHSSYVGYGDDLAGCGATFTECVITYVSTEYLKEADSDRRDQ